MESFHLEHAAPALSSALPHETISDTEVLRAGMHPICIAYDVNFRHHVEQQEDKAGEIFPSSVYLC